MSNPTSNPHVELLVAARVALNEMCHTTAPRNSFTDAVDRLDAAISACSAHETGEPPAGITWLIRGKPDFAHWRKDSKVPYSWCDCVSCSEARSAETPTGGGVHQTCKIHYCWECGANVEHTPKG